MNKEKQEALLDIQGAIVSAYVTNYYLHKVKIKGLNIFKHSLKNHVNRAIKELTKVEEKWYDEIDEADEKMTVGTSENQIKLIELLVQDKNYIDFVQLQQILLAYGLKPENIEGLAQKIIKENNLKNK